MTQTTQAKMDSLLLALGQTNPPPRLLLHSCCGPCSSYVLAYLASIFSITVFFHNPNIDTAEEFARRRDAQRQIIEVLPVKNPIHFQEDPYEPADFLALTKGLEDEAEGGKRCVRCFALRLKRAAEVAAAGGYDYFTTTLSVSPHKNSQTLNRLGEQIGRRFGVSYLAADFKKKGGYQQSVTLAKTHGLYRQSYCGCVFSKKQAEDRAQKQAEKPLG